LIAATVQEAASLAAFFGNHPMISCWVWSRFSERTYPFERAVIESELEILIGFSEKQSNRRGADANRAALTAEGQAKAAGVISASGFGRQASPSRIGQTLRWPTSALPASR
jgi:hypothetical protein